jgi:hypothetical protein
VEKMIKTSLNEFASLPLIEISLIRGLWFIPLAYISPVPPEAEVSLKP